MMTMIQTGAEGCDNLLDLWKIFFFCFSQAVAAQMRSCD